MPLKRSSKVLFLPRRARHGRHTRWRAAVANLEARVARLERRFGAGDRPTGAFEVTPRMRTALTGSVLFHIAIILGVGFTVPAKPKAETPSQSLEVVLVNAKTESKPVVADALAQVNLDGGGNTDEKRRASTPLPAVPEQKTDAEVKLALRRVEQLEREARQVMTQQRAPAPTPIETAQPVKPAPTAEPEVKPQPSAADIMQRSLELARLEAKIARDWQEYQERPRRRFIGSRVQESRFARYVEDWRQKIERIGDLNYPQAARDQRLHGSLVVTVAIRSDGSVEEMSIDRSSGQKVLDDGARRIVELSAPFAPFPPDIAKDVDILHITRTWTFKTGEGFFTK